MALIAGIATESGQLAEVLQILVETNLYEANPGGRMVQLFPGALRSRHPGGGAQR